jgi:glucose-6-phosphate 1-epimerase
VTAVGDPIEPGEGGLPRVVLSAETGRAEVYLHGAHVARWVDASGAEVLYRSPRARFALGEAIRGGIPVIFPQFADLGALPKHGFARTAQWTLAEAAGDHARLVLTDTDETRAIWDHAFHAELQVRLGDALSVALAVRNTGDSAFDFTCALHTYLRVGDIERTELPGLDGVSCHDKVDGADHVQAGDVLRFTGETDRVYRAAPDELRVRDHATGRTIVLRKHGFPDVVVWNPWARKAAEMDDLGEGEHRRFLCVEAARVAAPVRLEPGERWEGGQVISVAR